MGVRFLRENWADDAKALFQDLCATWNERYKGRARVTMETPNDRATHDNNHALSTIASEKLRYDGKPAQSSNSDTDLWA